MTPPPSTGSSFVRLLISYAAPDLQPTCHERSRIYDAELASITCGPADLPFDYSLFGSMSDLESAYDDDITQAETQPDPAGTCSEGNFEDIYGFEDGRTGRLNCRYHTNSSGVPYRVLEWAEQNTLVIGYISNRQDLHTWDDLYNLFVDQAGPYPH